MKFSTVAFLGLFATSASAFQSVSRPNGFLSRASLSTSLDVVDTAEYVERDVFTFDEWASRVGVQRCEGLQLTKNDGSDYFAITNQAIPAGSPVVYVPGEMVISSNRAQEEFGQSLQNAEERIKEGGVGNQIPIFRLGVKILVEWEKGEQSPWYYWLNSLPRLFSNGVSMTPACFEALPPYAGWLAVSVKSFHQPIPFVFSVYLSLIRLASSVLILFALPNYDMALNLNIDLFSTVRRQKEPTLSTSRRLSSQLHSTNRLKRTKILSSGHTILPSPGPIP